MIFGSFFFSRSIVASLERFLAILFVKISLMFSFSYVSAVHEEYFQIKGEKPKAKPHENNDVNL